MMCFIKLIYYENFSTIEEAISREKQLKNWHGEWKENLILSVNPTWKDLLEQIEH
jgi:putative endonuclease